MPSQYNAVINVDWLQIHCETTSLDPLPDRKGIFNDTYKIDLLEYGTPVFKNLYNIYDATGDHYAIVQDSPRSEILSRGMTIIKLANRELYKPGFIERLGRFLQQYSLTFIGISRIDICCDLNKFCTGLEPGTLIREFMAGKMLKNGLSAFAVYGKSNNVTKFTSLAFGSKSSAVRAYLYNKSKELREVKDKPYIRQLWAENGLDIDNDVWRVEISIKSDRTNLVRYDTGEIFRLNIDDLMLQESIKQLFIDYSRQYFAFKHNNGTKNKSRMPDVVLFNPSWIAVTKPIQITPKNDSTRVDKTVLRRIDHLFNELRIVTDTDKAAIQRVLSLFMVNKSLVKYYHDKVLPYRPPRTS